MPAPADNWFEALGKPVHPSQCQAALDMLVGEGYDACETTLVLSVVVREITHDNPKACYAYLRSHLGKRNETLVIRTLATLAAPTVATHRTELALTLSELS